MGKPERLKKRRRLWNHALIFCSGHTNIASATKEVHKFAKAGSEEQIQGDPPVPAMAKCIDRPHLSLRSCYKKGHQWLKTQLVKEKP